MYHRHPKRSVNVTTLAVPPRSWPGVSVRRSRCKRSQPYCRKRRSITISSRRTFAERTTRQLEVKFSSKKRSKASLKPRGSTHLPISLKSVAWVAQYPVVSHQIKYSSPKRNSAECLIKLGGSSEPVHTSESCKLPPQRTTVKATGPPTDNSNSCDPPAGEATCNWHKLTKKGASVATKHSELRKRSGPSDTTAAVSLLLMRYSSTVQKRCQIGKCNIGSLGKERKAKKFSRISTLRSRKLKEEVLGYLSGLSAESKELIREVNGEDLLRVTGKSRKGEERDGVELARGTMVHDRSVPEAPALAGHGRTSSRKRTPKACDCCGPNCRPQPPAKTPALGRPGRRGRRKKVLEAEPLTHAMHATPPPADDSARVNGADEPEAGPQRAFDMEVELPVTEPPVTEVTSLEEEPVLEAPEQEVPVLELPESEVPILESAEISGTCPTLCTNALLDHCYCKTEESDSEREQPENQLLTTGVNNEDLTELIHDFLEYFYEKYGSFIPLTDADVLDHLNKKLISDLTNRKSFIFSEVAKYRAGLASAPMHYFKVAYNKHTLTLEDLSTLDDQNWVNDQVINMYGELIADAAIHKVHFFNSFFHRQLVAKGYEGVKRWTKKVDLFSKSLLLIPIHLEIHWSLITVDITTQNIHFYDSQGIMFKYAVENILKYILAEAKEKQNTAYQKGWKMIVNKSIPQQKNDSDCGVFVLEYCKCLALKQPLQFTQEDMPKVRKRIYKELCECKLRC